MSWHHFSTLEEMLGTWFSDAKYVKLFCFFCFFLGAIKHNFIIMKVNHQKFLTLLRFGDVFAKLDTPLITVMTSQRQFRLWTYILFKGRTGETPWVQGHILTTCILRNHKENKLLFFKSDLSIMQLCGCENRIWRYSLCFLEFFMVFREL